MQRQVKDEKYSANWLLQWLASCATAGEKQVVCVGE